MIFRSRTLLITALLVGLVVPVSEPSEARLAEFGFCPLGGPPGWINRLTGEHHKRRGRYPPPWVVPYYSPLPHWQVPLRRSPPAAVPGRRQR